VSSVTGLGGIVVNFGVLKDYINGKWVEQPANNRMDVYNPSTGEVIAQINITPAEQVEVAIDAAAAAFPIWSRTSLGSRVEYLFKLHTELKARREELARVIATDQAKHIIDARGEVDRAIQLTETACGIPAMMRGNHFPVNDKIDGQVVKEPVGVIGALAPFNFPALVFGWFVPFAIGCGNTVVFKGSELSPVFMQKIAEIFAAIGLPKGVFNLVNGDSSVGNMLLGSPKIQAITFVGSTRVGQIIAEACAGTGKRSMILAGAKNTSIVLADANLDGFIDNIINACYGAAGQRCMATSNIAIVESVYDEVKAKFVAASQQVKVGDACDEKVYMGPVIAKAALEKAHRYIETALAEGGKMVLDGRNVVLNEANRNGYFIGPTIIEGITPEMTLAKEEVFAPVIALLKIKDLDEGIAIINRSVYGNGGTVYTEGGANAHKFLTQTNSGMLGVNIGVPAAMPYLPFGGTKSSLLGSQIKAQGLDAVDFFTKNKVATVRFYGYKDKTMKKETETCCALK
jgi:NAD-dependent aldehyde dehydrogenases